MRIAQVRQRQNEEGDGQMRLTFGLGMNAISVGGGSAMDRRREEL